MTDPLGKANSWNRDEEGRVTSKVYPDGKTYQFTYQPSSGRLMTVTDPKNQVKTYKYFADDTLQFIDHGAQLTANVRFEYDGNYRRMTKMFDMRPGPGESQTAFDYYAVGVLGAGRLSSVNGPLTGGSGDPDQVTYVYDQLGRVLSRTINSIGGPFAQTVTYDKLGRVNSKVTPIGTFGPAYVSDTARLSSLTYPGNPYNWVTF